MISVDLRGKSVVVTGATQGIGKTIAKAFARAGATPFITHRWSSVDEDELRAEFASAELPVPEIVECDASDAAATKELFLRVRESGKPLHALVSNVAFSLPVRELKDLKKASFELSLGYSAWPLIEMVQTSFDVLGRHAPYVLAISSDGGERCLPGYDFAGASKAVLETFCRYLAVRLKSEGVRVNAIRPGLMVTASTLATFGPEVMADVSARAPGVFTSATRVGDACVALTSGLLDGLTGQVVTIDEGWNLFATTTLVAGEILNLLPTYRFPEDT